jgi:mono/diheme cytochrome c family protein
MVRIQLGLALAARLVVGQVTNSPTAPRLGGNPEAAKMTNPIPPSAESASAGKRTYQRLCLNCHGPAGKGDGGGAGAGGQPADLTDGHWDYGATDGEIFSVIREGTSADMQGYADQVGNDEIWKLVNYLRTIGPRK